MSTEILHGHDSDARGVRIVKPLEERPWGTLDSYVEDPEGDLLCFSEVL